MKYEHLSESHFLCILIVCSRFRFHFIRFSVLIEYIIFLNSIKLREDNNFSNHSIVYSHYTHNIFN